ncbi:hypothetical protein [Limnovirga soli]|uniref:hypothetical protein n=1 Tax=Limnovirga soli TaxID=2656915 RepID=UPI001491C8C7|nr:hypothetical protein [Limnovirga soli]
MGLIKEPLDVDFVVDPRPLTKAEEKAISDFIRADKEKRKLKELRAKAKRKTKQLS